MRKSKDYKKKYVHLQPQCNSNFCYDITSHESILNIFLRNCFKPLWEYNAWLQAGNNYSCMFKTELLK